MGEFKASTSPRIPILYSQFPIYYVRMITKRKQLPSFVLKSKWVDRLGQIYECTPRHVNVSRHLPRLPINNCRLRESPKGSKTKIRNIPNMIPSMIRTVSGCYEANDDSRRQTCFDRGNKF